LNISRRDLLAKIGLALNVVAAGVLATPVVGYLLSPILRGDRGQYKRWVALGGLTDFPEGQTRLAKFQSVTGVSDGDTDHIPRWSGAFRRRVQVFAINCAQLRPVRWFAQSGPSCVLPRWRALRDGSRASNPPPALALQYQ
jgi:hypothetical protein